MQLQYQGMNMIQRFPELVMWDRDGEPVRGWNVHEVQIYDERPERLHFMTKYSLGIPGCRPAETGQAKWTFQPGREHLSMGFPPEVPPGKRGGAVPGGAPLDGAA